MRLILLLISLNLTGCSIMFARDVSDDSIEAIDCGADGIWLVLDLTATGLLVVATLKSKDATLTSPFIVTFLASSVYADYKYDKCVRTKERQYQKLVEYRNRPRPTPKVIPPEVRELKAKLKAKTEACRLASSCAEDGSCSYENGKCAPTKAFHCEMSNQCKSLGRCSLSAGRCQAVEATDCSESLMCKSKGLCVVSNGECVAGK